jgi:glycosyltransferase involved in cell wall biosynthesis
MNKKVFFVDRYINYSTELFFELEKIFQNEKNEITFLGPLEFSKENFSAQSVKNARKIWSYGKYIKPIYSFIKKNKPDLVHFSFELKTYGPLTTLWKFLILLFLIKNSKTKTVLTLHNILVYKENNTWQIHSYITRNIPKFIIKLFLRLFFKLMCRFADKIIVGTDIGKLALMEFYGISEKKVSVIHLGVNTTKNQQINNISERLRNKIGTRKIILCFGVISPRKGQELAIKAFNLISKQLSDYVLIIAGKAPQEYKGYEKNLNRMVQQLGLKNSVIFTDFLDDDEIDPLFNKAEMTLFIYKPMSSSTHALTYALKNSTPVIVSNLETFHEILDDNSAIFVEYDDEKKLSESIIELVNNIKLRNSLLENIENIRIKHDWRNVANSYVKIYEKLI